MGILLQPDLFDVGKCEKQNADIKAKEHAEKVREAQKCMTLPYFENPQNDNEKLLNLQHDYIQNNDAGKWGELLMFSYKIIKRLIWKTLKENKNMFLDEIEQEEKASIALHYVMRRYQNNVGYAVQKNYISFLKGGVKHALRYTTKLEQNTVSLDDYIENTKAKEEKL